ncbi:MAG: hypothetical protein IPP88_20720 [Betaproteobacteria bacterium]|nr:hypothetical protein [Betaproteobacteria bacterium]
MVIVNAFWYAKQDGTSGRSRHAGCANGKGRALGRCKRTDDCTPVLRRIPWGIDVHDQGTSCGLEASNELGPGRGLLPNHSEINFALMQYPQKTLHGAQMNAVVHEVRMLQLDRRNRAKKLHDAQWQYCGVQRPAAWFVASKMSHGHDERFVGRQNLFQG